MPEYTPLPAEIWMLEHWPQVEQFNFQWVAVDGTDIIGHSPDLDALMTDVDRRGLARDALYVFVEYPQQLEGGE